MIDPYGFIDLMLAPFALTVKKVPQPRRGYDTLIDPMTNERINFVRDIWNLKKPEFMDGFRWNSDARFHLTVVTDLCERCNLTFVIHLWRDQEGNGRRYTVFCQDILVERGNVPEQVQ